jgi:hypothetical protein
MRYLEIINETTEQDRLIVNLANNLNSHVKRYEYNDEIINQGIYLGKIQKLSTIHKGTDIEVLDPVHIELVTDRYMNQISPSKTGNTRALWKPDLKTVYLNTDYIGDSMMPRLIAHELRHALDSFVSDFDPGTRYDTPRKKEYQYYGNHPVKSRLEYLARPSEINARFLEVLHLLSPVIEKTVNSNRSDTFVYLFDKFKFYLLKKEILDLFPEGTESQDLRRLYKRGIDYIISEVERLKKEKG